MTSAAHNKQFHINRITFVVVDVDDVGNPIWIRVWIQMIGCEDVEEQKRMNSGALVDASFTSTTLGCLGD